MMGEPYFEILLGMVSAIKLKKPTKKRSEVGNKMLERTRIVLERLHNNQAASAPSSAQKEGEQQTPSTSQVMLVRSESSTSLSSIGTTDSTAAAIAGMKRSRKEREGGNSGSEVMENDDDDPDTKKCKGTEFYQIRDYRGRFNIDVPQGKRGSNS